MSIFRNDRPQWLATGCLAVLVTITGCQPKPPATQPMEGMVDYVRGYEAFQEGNRDAAVRALNQAVTENPNLITARGLLADIYRREGNYEEAVGHYDRLTDLDPYDYLNFYHLGVSQHFLNRIEEAVASYRSALRLRPNDPKVNMNLGLAYMVLGQTDRALPFAKRAVELSPSGSAAWGNYGLVLDATGQTGPAADAYRRSLELNPRQSGVRINYGTNLIRQNRPREAINLLEAVASESKSVLALRRLGDAYAADGQTDRAIEQYNAALALNPRYYPAMNQIAELRIGQYEKGLQLDESLRDRAVEQWRRSVEIFPDQPRVTELLQKWDRNAAT